MILNRFSTYKRCMSIQAKALKFNQFGEPLDVLNLVQYQVELPKETQVLVKVLAAPINPSDINTIQGKYPIRPQLPAVAGNECVAEVIAIGDKVKNLSIGDHVVTLDMGLGTWTTHAIFKENQLLSIPKNIGLFEAASLTINPSTAYRMLKDFKQLEPGDCVIQNGANSAVGQVVHQLCKAWHLNSVGIVRDRLGIDELKAHLISLGASSVHTEEEFASILDIFKEGTLEKPKLALNCVGGKSTSELARHLDNKGILVTYGGMSQEPIKIPTAQLIFKNLTLCGFNITKWVAQNRHMPAHKSMLDELCALMASGVLVTPEHEFISLADFKAASGALSFKGFTSKKYVLTMNE